MEVQAPPGCPVLAGYDPLDPAELRNPYPGFKRARDEAPVFFEKYGFWTITRYDDVLAVLNDDEHYSNKLAIPMPLPPEDLRDRMPVYPFMTALLFKDNPEHRAARTMVQEPFIPRRLKQREPRIYSRAQELITQREDRRDRVPEGVRAAARAHGDRRPRRRPGAGLAPPRGVGERRVRDRADRERRRQRPGRDPPARRGPGEVLAVPLRPRRGAPPAADRRLLLDPRGLHGTPRPGRSRPPTRSRRTSTRCSGPGSRRAPS